MMHESGQESREITTIADEKELKQVVVGLRGHSELVNVECAAEII
jgi:hypothetical protein